MYRSFEKTSAVPMPGAMTSPKQEPCSKYLSFRLAKGEFAISVSILREIMGLQEVTVIPQTAPYVKGALNLRGKLIPVIDLRIKFGLPQSAPTNRTWVVVVQLENTGGKLIAGMIVDGVSEVLSLRPSEIQDRSGMTEDPQVFPLLGIIKDKGKVRGVLDMQRALSPEELCALQAAVQ